MTVKNVIVLRFHGWIIKHYSVGYMIYHKDDVKRHHVLYFPSISATLKNLYEKLLIENIKSPGYDASLTALKRVIEKTNDMFETVLSKKLLKMVWEERGKA